MESVKAGVEVGAMDVAVRTAVVGLVRVTDGMPVAGGDIACPVHPTNAKVKALAANNFSYPVIANSSGEKVIYPFMVGYLQPIANNFTRLIDILGASIARSAVHRAEIERHLQQIDRVVENSHRLRVESSVTLIPCLGLYFGRS